MFSWLFKELESIFNVLLWLGLVGGGIVYLVCVVISKFLPKVLTPTIFPTFRMVQYVALMVAGICGFVKLVALIMFLLNAKAENDKLKDQLVSKQEVITNLQQNAGRKEAQKTDVSKGDKEIEVRYLDRWRTIESIREVPDLSIANKLMLDITTKFYDSENTNEVVTK